MNLSQLKRNSRRRLDKKSGRKHPRPNEVDDTEITVNPNSKLSNMISTKESCVERNIPQMATDLSIPHNGEIEALNEDKFESKRFQVFIIIKKEGESLEKKSG